ncbi:UNKNOWN [Stylonychia lemnae]|uniref:Uncharacterized protein n=1 Tax=Stylonychia lemnae TaxID=5949 RepID=A0A078A1M8_STYLE|nr:UNKNOWN [Stylonychia lemnae]|eukprot:CDW74684.1 UNKNOWN [Stylonychia lemnae]
MSVESLKQNKSVRWVDEQNFKSEEFGPPNFDEYPRSFKWRQFKKGFSWGFLMTSTVVVQYQLYMHVIRPAEKSLTSAFTQSGVYGLGIGIAFGFYEIYNHPQIIHQQFKVVSDEEYRQMQARRQISEPKTQPALKDNSKESKQQ